MIGIHGGLTEFNINTDNFITEKQSGWAFGLTGIVNVEHKWFDFSYGLQFSENSIDISGRMMSDVQENELLEFKLSAVQLSALLHAKIIGQNLTVDFGPILQANGKLELKEESQENFYINGYDDLQARDIEDISKFNINGAVGVTAGFKHFRLRAQYQYGVTNLLNKLNDLEIGGNKFKGNQSQLLLSAMVLF